MPRTRIAPSPTGALHLGNARTFLVNWALARQQGWEIVLRIEDLDGPRVKAGASDQAIELLRWLGIDWDEGPYYQLNDLRPYQEALTRLAAMGTIYPCRCTRKEIEAASLSAPHAGDHELCYPGTCRPAEAAPTCIDLGVGESAPESNNLSWRVRAPNEPIRFVDQFAGPQSFNIQNIVGDFLVRTKAGSPSYQLAVVVDDARQRIDQVVRSNDLLTSTPRQLLLYEFLELLPVPTYTHLPLVIGEDGRRLAKRHGDSRLLHYRKQGVSTERVIGLLAEWCGCGPRKNLAAQEFLTRFKLENLSPEPIVYTSEDDAWLLQN